MRKTFLYFSCITLFFLGSCAPTPPPDTTGVAPTALTIIIPTPPPTEPACTSLNLEPTPGPEIPSLFPTVSAADYTRGPADAAVTIIVYDDFQCKDCNYLPISRLLLQNHPGDVRFVYRYYPYTTLFDKGQLAAQAAEAAARQDKFWDMHDLLFDKQTEWIDLPVDSFEGWVTKQAVGLGLDQTRFTADFKSAETIQKIQTDAEQDAKIGIPRLPFYLVNGQIYRGPTDYEAFSQVVSLITLGEHQFAQCPSMNINPRKQYIATLETEKGEIVLQLYPDRAPLAVNSFVFLAQSGWYDGITFHRVIPGFLAQSGDPSGTGQGNPGYLFKNEVDPKLNFDQAGMVAMANSGPDTNGSQFFITFVPMSNLNGSYTVFGRVLSGMDVLAKLTPRDPQPGVVLPPGDKLIKVTIEEK
jgi:cyclophilin family peptidyl-prolyl cis-trans isomerase/protein-disulfide isomerase